MELFHENTKRLPAINYFPKKPIYMFDQVLNAPLIMAVVATKDGECCGFAVTSLIAKSIPIAVDTKVTGCDCNLEKIFNAKIQSNSASNIQNCLQISITIF